MFKNMHDLQAHHLLQVKGTDDGWFVPSPWPSTVSPSFQTGFSQARFKAAPVCQLIMWAQCSQHTTVYLPHGQEGIGVVREKNQILIYIPT